MHWLGFRCPNRDRPSLWGKRASFHRRGVRSERLSDVLVWNRADGFLGDDHSGDITADHRFRFHLCPNHCFHVVSVVGDCFCGAILRLFLVIHRDIPHESAFVRHHADDGSEYHFGLRTGFRQLALARNGDWRCGTCFGHRRVDGFSVHRGVHQGSSGCQGILPVPFYALEMESGVEKHIVGLSHHVSVSDVAGQLVSVFCHHREAGFRRAGRVQHPEESAALVHDARMGTFNHGEHLYEQFDRATEIPVDSDPAPEIDHDSLGVGVAFRTFGFLCSAAAGANLHE